MRPSLCCLHAMGIEHAHGCPSMAAPTSHAASATELLHSQANKSHTCQGSAAERGVPCICTGYQLLGLLQAAVGCHIPADHLCHH